MSNNLGHNRMLSRREFTLESALAMLAGVAITISGCGTDSPSRQRRAGAAAGGTATSHGDVSANHGHVATITGGADHRRAAR